MTELYVPATKELWLPRMGAAGPYFHGGKPGQHAGAMLVAHVPETRDSCPVCQLKRKGRDEYARALHFTTDREYGRVFAHGYPRGDLYSVQPVGEVMMLNDHPFPVAICHSALIRSVAERYVQLDAGERRRLARRWFAADKARR